MLLAFPGISLDENSTSVAGELPGFTNIVVYWFRHIRTPFLSGSGPSHFRAQIQQTETLSDFINFVSFGHLFCHDLDLTILLHQDVHLAQTELYQMDIPTRALKRYECCRNFSEPFGASRSMLLAKWRTIWYAT